jgi:hypothetical protein
MILKKFPTPELQAAHDNAYMHSVQGPKFWDEVGPDVDDPSNVAQVQMRLAWMAGHLAGMEDWALKNGIKTTLLGQGPSGHS